MNLMNMKNSTGLLAVVVLAGLAGVLAGMPARGAADGSWKSGAEAYQKVCSRCHLSGVGPELRGRNLPPAYIKAIARNGLRAMPAFMDSALDDATLEQVAALIAASKLPAGATPATTPTIPASQPKH